MRPVRLYVKGLTVLGTVDIDFTKLPDGLIAITGPNGSGKTSLMSAIFAALYRYLPDRDGSLPKWCHGRDAQILLECDFNGHRYSCRVMVDAVSENQEAFLLEDGKPVGDVKGRVTQYDREIRRIFGPPELMLSSAFSSQRRVGAFSRIPVSERKALFTDLLGLGHYPDKEKQAKAALEQETLNLEKLRGECQAMERQVADLAAIDIDLAKVTTQREWQQSNLAQAMVERQSTDLQLLEYAEKIGSFADLELKRDRWAESYRTASGDLATVRQKTAQRKVVIQKERVAFDAAIQKLKDRILDVRTRRANNATLLARREEIAAAVTREKELARTRTTLNGELSDAFMSQQAMGSAKVRLTSAQGALGLLDQTIRADAARVRELDGIPCHGKGPYAACQYIANAVAAKESLPGHLEERERQAVAVNQLALEASKNGHRPVSAIQDELLALDQLMLDTQKLAKLMDAVTQADEKIQEYDSFLKDLDAQMAEAVRMRSAQGDDDDLLKEYAEQEAGLIQHEQSVRVSLDDCMAQLKERADLVQARARAKLLLEEQANTVRGLSDQCARMASEIHALTVRKAELDDVAAQLAAKVQQIAALGREVTEWTMLVRGVGPNGVPALEIDAAGPSISAIINDLLASCFSTRFAVDLQTQRLNADGKKQIETFNLRVIDTEKNRTGTIDDLSGGEEVIVSEALGLGISIYNKGENRFETAMRDETTGALDIANVPRYIEMLRRARTAGGFRQIIFITHSQEAGELADAHIHCEAGVVTVG